MTKSAIGSLMLVGFFAILSGCSTFTLTNFTQPQDEDWRRFVELVETGATNGWFGPNGDNILGITNFWVSGDVIVTKGQGTKAASARTKVLACRRSNPPRPWRRDRRWET